MDSVIIGIIVTVIFFITFIGIFFWAWSDRRKKDFESAANLPFEEDVMPKNNAYPRH